MSALLLGRRADQPDGSCLVCGPPCIAKPCGIQGDRSTEASWAGDGVELSCRPAAATSHDTLKDFAPIVLAATAPYILAVNPSLPVNSPAELIACAKANPGKLNAGSHEKGNTSHLAMLRSATGIDFTVVHYKGAQPAAAALISSEVSFMFGTGLVIPHAQAGRVRVIATTGPKRSSSLPDVPTMIEAGFAEFQVVSWYGFFAPPGTPPGALDTLNRGIDEELAEPSVRARILKFNLDPMGGGSPEELDRLVRSQILRWANVIKTAGIDLTDPALPPGQSYSAERQRNHALCRRWGRLASPGTHFLSSAVSASLREPATS